MKKIVVAGQLDKEKIAALVKEIAKDQAEITIKEDIQAAMDMKAGLFDYYIGACNTGGGGAIAMPMALYGAVHCTTLSMPGKIKDTAEIKQLVDEGKTVFGFTAQHAEQVIPILVPLLLAK
ncbi:MAG: DUF2620 domain-containing protein [Alphaproteobacteria bacterium]|jgi:hypothetical protein|nr:DUF2620 domain-containing protein [Alphaproteobacteria bacterium]